MYKANTATAMLNAQKAAMAPGMPAPAPGPELGSQVGTGRLRSYTPMRLRLNTVLNAMTSRGSFVGNNAGVLGRLLPCASSAAHHDPCSSHLQRHQLVHRQVQRAARHLREHAGRRWYGSAMAVNRCASA
jgi:hypothetical protein